MYTFTRNVSIYHMYFSFTVHYSCTENKYFHVRFIGKNHFRQFYLQSYESEHDLRSRMNNLSGFVRSIAKARVRFPVKPEFFQVLYNLQPLRLLILLRISCSLS